MICNVKDISNIIMLAFVKIWYSICHSFQTEFMAECIKHHHSNSKVQCSNHSDDKVLCNLLITLFIVLKHHHNVDLHS